MMFFRRSEFACKCGCGFDTVDYELARIADSIREYFDKPVIVNSGCRCVPWNIYQGGALKSQHLLGRAMDIRINGIAPQLIAEAAAQFGARGIKAYDSFCHVDTRSGDQWSE